MSCTRKMTLERRILLRIVDEARRRGFKLRALANASGIEVGRMYQLSRMNCVLSTEELYRLSKVIGVSMETLVAEAMADGQREV